MQQNRRREIPEIEASLPIPDTGRIVGRLLANVWVRLVRVVKDRSQTPEPQEAGLCWRILLCWHPPPGGCWKQRSSLPVHSEPDLAVRYEGGWTFEIWRPSTCGIYWLEYIINCGSFGHKNFSWNMCASDQGDPSGALTCQVTRFSNLAGGHDPLVTASTLT